jgi:DNA ligase 1
LTIASRNLSQSYFTHRVLTIKNFANLYSELDASTSTSAKVAALKAYFDKAQPADAAWAVFFLAGGKPKQTVANKVLRQATLKASGLSEWLFEESYQAVGDLAETIAHVLPAPTQIVDLGLAQWMVERLLPLRGAQPDIVIDTLRAYWSTIDIAQRFLLNKLITGGFRVGVSKLLVIRGLEEATGIDRKALSQRLMGYTDVSSPPSREKFLQLIDSSEESSAQQLTGQPYPFFLAHQWVQAIDENEYTKQLGRTSEWLVEWKWDGIRAQLVKRNDSWWLWSRGEELITDRFPELAAMAESLPNGTVLDGEVLAWDFDGDKPMQFAKLQTRIARKTLSAKLLKEVPVVLQAYDCLETGGTDIREQSQEKRRLILEGLGLEIPSLKLSQRVLENTWQSLHQLREQSRARGVEGFMLKNLKSAYGVGRTKADGIWWKWKIDPLTVDCVLVYAQSGHGRRASLYTDYTFAVWDGKPDAGGKLVPFAKAYSGLTDAEFKKVDEVIRKTTIEKFGPVRSVTPTLVFELAFEGIQESPRHKSGIAVRFPRILRWREDKAIADADSLENLRALLG